MEADAHSRYNNKQSNGSKAPCLIAKIEFCPFDIFLCCAWISNQDS